MNEVGISLGSTGVSGGSTNPAGGGGIAEMPEGKAS